MRLKCHKLPEVLLQPSNCQWDEWEWYWIDFSQYYRFLKWFTHKSLAEKWCSDAWKFFFLCRQIKTSFLSPEHKSFSIPQAKQTKIPSLHITVCDINLRDKLIIASASRVHFEVLQWADSALLTHTLRHMTDSHVHVQTHTIARGWYSTSVERSPFWNDVSHC